MAESSGAAAASGARAVGVESVARGVAVVASARADATRTNRAGDWSIRVPPRVADDSTALARPVVGAGKPHRSAYPAPWPERSYGHACVVPCRLTVFSTSRRTFLTCPVVPLATRP